MSVSDDNVARAMAVAQQSFEAMSVAFGVWVRSLPDGTVPIVGTGTGIAKLAGTILEQISNDAARDAAVVGAVATLLVNSGCNIPEALRMIGDALHAHELATTEAAGHA